jgi:hypothetical protein
MRLLPCLLLAVAIPAQTATVNIGLQAIGGTATIGQECGPLTCTPFQGGAIGLGQQRSLIHWSVPVAPYLIAMGLPAPCQTVPGIANSLLVDPASTVLLAAGVTTVPTITGFCLQGQGRYTLIMPASAPLPITFRLQSAGMTTNLMVGLGPAIELTLQ